jgi:hypothetical protein
MYSAMFVMRKQIAVLIGKFSDTEKNVSRSLAKIEYFPPSIEFSKHLEQ